jgi:predicted TIM-barrel fold metal-dependent hydrolase
MRDNDADGVAMEVVFPQWLLFLLHHPDLEVREYVFSTYNEYLAEVQRKAPGRFFGVGIANYWDAAKARQSVERIKDLGLKTFMLPMNPGKDALGHAISYAGKECEALCAAAEETGLPVCYHIGENVNIEGPAGVGIGVLSGIMPFRRNFAELTFGGVFDRHPALRVAFCEAGINWIPGVLQDAEMVLDSWGKLMARTELRPTEYWQRHCFATFMSDSVGLELLEYIGADKVMWSADYPHNEGTHGYTAAIINSIVDTLGPHEAKLILGGTAIDFFGLPAELPPAIRTN